MDKMMNVTLARREKQIAYNKEHNITPTSIKKSIQESLSQEREAAELEQHVVKEDETDYSVLEVIGELEKEMLEASEALEYERSAILRDQIYELQQAGKGEKSKHPKPQAKKPYKVRRKKKAASK